MSDDLDDWCEAGCGAELHGTHDDAIRAGWIYTWDGWFCPQCVGETKDAQKEAAQREHNIPSDGYQ